MRKKRQLLVPRASATKYKKKDGWNPRRKPPKRVRTGHRGQAKGRHQTQSPGRSGRGRRFSIWGSPPATTPFWVSQQCVMVKVNPYPQMTLVRRKVLSGPATPLRRRPLLKDSRSAATNPGENLWKCRERRLAHASSLTFLRDYPSVLAPPIRAAFWMGFGILNGILGLVFSAWKTKVNGILDQPCGRSAA